MRIFDPESRLVTKTLHPRRGALASDVTGESTRIPTPHKCACGSADVVAIKPGYIGTGAIYTLTGALSAPAIEPVACQFWCFSCWPAMRPSEAPMRAEGAI